MDFANQERKASAFSSRPSSPTVKTDQGVIPHHIAIIMDGNGRWAQKRGLPRLMGHREGMKTVRRIVKAAQGRGVAFLTLFSFSTENWTRPLEEIGELMRLLKFFVRSDLNDLRAQNVRVLVIGEAAGLSPEINQLLRSAEEKTKDCTGLTLVIAFNYGARAEMIRATQKLAQQVLDGGLKPEAIGEEHFSAALSTAAIPDPDLIIRTSGEQRISNFLLWQCAYSEFIFTPILWPDFDEEAFDAALLEFSRRQRRFGGIGETIKREEEKANIR